MQREFSKVINDGVTRIITAGETHDHIGLLGY
jgi:hypothetical protein